MGLKKIKSEEIGLIGIVVIAVVILIMGVFIIIYQQSVAKANNQVILALKIEKANLEARRQEKNFLIRNEMEYVTKVLDTKDTINRLLNQLDADIKEFDDYYVTFTRLVEKKAKVEEYESTLVPIARDALKKIEEIQVLAEKNIAVKQKQAIVMIILLSGVNLEILIGIYIIVNKARKNILQRENEVHGNAMNLAMNITDYMSVISSLSIGGLDIRASESTGDELFDQLGKTTNKMVDSMKQLTESAEKIAEGDLSVEVNVRSDKDVLSKTFIKMRDSLKRTMDELHSNMMNLAMNLTDYLTVVSALSQGDLTVTANEQTGDDLFNQLGKSTNKMINNLRSLIQQIETSINNLVQSAEGLSQITAQSSQNISQVANIVTQISSSTSQVAQNAQVSSQSGQNANNSVISGKEMVLKLSGQMNTISNDVKTIVTVINNLANESTRISEIVNVIVKISDQTNLLSLNAAIEAARAGEVGRGFAVVADEVRKLAESSASSAEEIKKIIARIIEITKESVDVASTGLNKTEQGVNVMKEVEQKFNDIATVIHITAEEIEQIAAATEETSASAEEVSASVEQQNAGIEEIAAQASTLAGSAKELKNAISSFKL
jgi:methyl-accepting chemotaxis protein